VSAHKPLEGDSLSGSAKCGEMRNREVNSVGSRPHGAGAAVGPGKSRHPGQGHQAQEGWLFRPAGTVRPAGFGRADHTAGSHGEYTAQQIGPPDLAQGQVGVDCRVRRFQPGGLVNLSRQYTSGPRDGQTAAQVINPRVGLDKERRHRQVEHHPVSGSANRFPGGIRPLNIGRSAGAVDLPLQPADQPGMRSEICHGLVLAATRIVNGHSREARSALPERWNCRRVVRLSSSQAYTGGLHTLVRPKVAAKCCTAAIWRIPLGAQAAQPNQAGVSMPQAIAAG